MRRVRQPLRLHLHAATLTMVTCQTSPWGYNWRTMQYTYEHADSGVLFNVDFTPPTTVGEPIQLNEVRVYDATYRTCGPNLLSFMHNSFTLNTHTQPAVATRLLEEISQEIQCLKN